jgi:2OG-Fe(II) oxygenase superfamily
MEVTYHTPQIWTLADFLTPRQCDDLIMLSESIGYDEATVSLPSGAQMMKGLRNNERLLYTDTVLADRYWQRLQAHCPATIDDAVAVGLNEQFRFYKYGSTQRFKRHIDGRFRRNTLEESRITFMIYLNDEFSGGETAFDEVTIAPRPGTALCFIHELKHEGCPVMSGTKYVLRSDVMYRRG